MKSLLLALFLILVPVTANADRLSLNQITESTCRVQSGEVFGSGVVIRHYDGKYWILSNAHVVGREKTVYLEFFKNGRKTPPLPAKVEWVKLQARTEIDFALVSIPESYFGKYGPRVAELAPPNAVAVGGYIMSAGSPEARWPVAFEGFLINQDEGKLLFYPPPVGGQSGSGLFIVTKEGDQVKTYLKGIVTWRIEEGYNTDEPGYEDAQGGASTIDRFLDTIHGRVNVSNEKYILPANYKVVALPRLFPRPNPNPEPEPAPNVVDPPTPNPDPAPVPTPNVNENPFNNLPNFDDLSPVEEIPQEKPQEEKPQEEVKPMPADISWVNLALATVVGAIGTWASTKGKDIVLKYLKKRAMQRMEDFEIAVHRIVVDKLGTDVDEKVAPYIDKTDELLDKTVTDLVSTLDLDKVANELRDRLISKLKK